MKRVFFAVLLFLAGCKIIQNQNNYSICIEDGVSRLEVKEEFAACYKISAAEMEKYKLFSKAEILNRPSDENELRARLKSNVNSMIAEVILFKLKDAFGQNVEEYWQLEKITIPVYYRSFKKTAGNEVTITVIGIIPENEMTARALIKYLPLEYKMQFIDKKEEKYYFKDDPMNDF